MADTDYLGAGLLKPSEVAALFRVEPKTVARWAGEGRIPVQCYTPGGHRRFNEKVVHALLMSGGLK